MSKDEDGEYENTKGLENKQMLQQQKDMLKGQDDALDRIAGVVDNIKLENQNFATEVKSQNKMLDKVNDEIDDTTADMIKIDTKLKTMMMRGGVCKLWVCLIIEMIVFISLLVKIF